MKTSTILKLTAASLTITPFLVGGNIVTASKAKAEVDFAGKRVVWIVGAREGGGSDNFTRAIAKFFSKHLPGQPKILIRNLPGTGGIPGQNYFWQNAQDDGLMLVTTSTSQIMNQVMNTEAVKYDVTKYKTVLASPQGTFAYANPKTGVKGPQDIKKLVASGKAYRFGGYGPTSSEIRLMVSWKLLGIKIKPLWGMSRGKTRQAFMRDEVDVNYDSASSWLKKVMPLVKKGEAIPLFSFGIQNEKDEFERDPTAPDMPHYNEVYEMVHGKKLSGDVRDVWESLFNIAIMTSKSINLHPSTKPEVYDAYVKAAKAMFKDPKFKKVRKKRIGAYKVLFGEDARKRVAKAANPSAQTRAWLKKFLKENHDVDVNM
jgi:tripartite-type tricarboxylate transporter receptor subunit TctC